MAGVFVYCEFIRIASVKKICGKQIKFCRYGGLSPVIQRGYKETKDEPTFHSPPARKGFYAFVYPYIEVFLLGGGYGETKFVETGVKDEYGDPIRELVKPKIFEYEGILWHHLGKHCHGSDIIQRHNEWYKTTFDVYVEALRKEFHELRISHEKFCREYGKGEIITSNNPTKFSTRDHLEVFIERIK